MKHNLKNRPETRDVYYKDQTYTHYPDEWEFNEWFEGFQKELQERVELAFAEPSDEMDKLDNCIKLLEEIMGE